MFKQIHEISVAVSDLAQAVESFRGKLGLEPSEVQSDPRPPVQSRFARFRVGDACITLMESTTSGSPIDRFLQRRGEGIFSISVRVEDIEKATSRLRANGVEIVLDKPIVRENYRGFDKTYALSKVNFTHPRSLHGILLELQELVD